MINLYHMKRNELFKDYYRRISNTQTQNQHIQSDSPSGCSNMIFFFFPPPRPAAGLPHLGRLLSDPQRFRGTGDVSCHGVGLRVPLHAEGRPIERLFTLKSAERSTASP